MDIEDKIKQLPDSPGVYILKDGEGKPIYVGKASSLKKRVPSHFNLTKVSYSPKQEALIVNTKDIEYISTGSEAEALLFEAAVIKEMQPKYNVELKDDKSFPMLKLTLNETWPRLSIVRKRKDDGARYFGPYTSAKLLRQAVKILRRLFPLRMCKDFPKPCIDYYIGQCWAPWLGEVDSPTYHRIVDELILFLEGKRAQLLKELFIRMDEASEEKRFEEAAKLRNQIEALTCVITKQKKIPLMEQLEELKDVLLLKLIPKRIEAFDVSNIQGNQATGSMVLFLDGMPDKSNYRRFKVKTVSGIDDYKMIGELICRRYTRCLQEKEKLPDLLIIDGGKGHLSVAIEELERLGLKGLNVVGIAKQFEHIYLPQKDEPLLLPPNSKALHLIQRIRDEAHRFAIGYHHRLRSRLSSASKLDEISGIGPKLKTALVKYFGSVDEIKEAKIEDIAKVRCIGKKRAEIIKRGL